ncbi:exosortase family protein XrtG [Lacticaseibacillus jixiensis]|uniref:exosortase family protein XrtG n=1 Tax=Lacticaseibacillus jixiensis TaxID=3231926 RepID=UPI0036F435FA
MGIYLLIGAAVWLYVLSVLKRARLSAFYFIVGSAGLFFVLMAIADPYWVWFFTHAVIHGVQWLAGDLLHWCHVTMKTGLVYIPNHVNSVVMSIDFECSGIIESAALVALVVYFPTYARREKVFYAGFGVLYIYLANIIRLLTVIAIVHYAGGQWYYLAHAIIGRLVFYVLVIALYYNVFTYSQLARGIYRELGFDRRQP